MSAKEMPAELGRLAGEPRVRMRPMSGASLVKKFDAGAYIRQQKDGIEEM